MLPLRLTWLRGARQRQIPHFTVQISPRTPTRVCRACRAYPCHLPLSGYIFVDFSSEEEVKKALKCNREYMGG
jgi:hypothetical protein